MKSLFFFFVALLIGLPASAQIFGKRKKENNDTTAQVKREDYIKDHPDHFFIWPVLKQRSQDFELKISDPHKRTVGYYSNKPYSFGIGVYLFELAAEITFAIPLNEKSKRIYGESETSNLQLNLLGKKWGIEGYFQKYKGFYIKDSKAVVPSNTPYLQRPDVRTQNIGLNVNYIFNNKKFSFRASYNFSESQLKSGGSFLVFGTFDDFRIEGDSALLGDKFEDDFLRSAKIKEINSIIFGIEPGYTYSLINQGFYINTTLGIGPGFSALQYTLEDGSSGIENKVNVLVALKVAVGYNGDRFFGGFSFGSQSSNAVFDHVHLTSAIASFKILAGYRILERGILKKRAKDIQKGIRH